ncbi:MAG: sugar transporter, partial [Flavobacterium psychrophilum]
MNKLIVFLFFGILFLSAPAMAQGVLSGNDLKALNVDQLSDDQISQIQAELKGNNMSIDQAETVALSKGMSKSEFAKLRGRLAATKTANSSAGNAGNVVDRKITSTSESFKNPSNPLIFGSELFNNPALSFAPNDKIATPLNYMLGPGDELLINLYGVQEFNTTAAVSVEGKISLPYVGQIPVSGTTIEAATQKIRSSMAKVYSTLA